ncbi:MAG: chemotaxis protein CheW [Planctomycetaceae bacterium]
MNHAETSLCDQYCVFSVGGAEYAVSAASVREVADLVPIVAVPQSAAVLKGLCHHRNDFLPVLSLPAVLGEPTQTDFDCQFLLVMDGGDGPWALPISRAFGLESLEMASTGEAIGDVPRSVVKGTASFRDGVVRVLDPDRLYHDAVDVLCDVWTNRDLRSVAHESSLPFHSPAHC